MFRPPAPDESPELVALAASTDAFQPGEAEELLGGTLKEFHAGSLGEGHQAQIWADDRTGAAAGWVYFAPTFRAEGIWDLWWIGVDPASQGRGIGGKLLEFVESRVREAGGRILIIETSSTDPFDSVRRFYTKRGYTNCGRIPDFYAENDDKITFAKRITDLQAQTPPLNSELCQIIGDGRNAGKVMLTGEYSSLQRKRVDTRPIPSVFRPKHASWPQSMLL